MTAPDMDPGVAAAVRHELAAIGTRRSRLQRHQRRARIVAAGVIALLVAGATTGAAIVASRLPGATTITPLSGVRSVTHTGSGTFDLGPAPAGATRVVFTLRCHQQRGTISIDDRYFLVRNGNGYATFFCKGRPTPWHESLAVPTGSSTRIEITADPGTTWTATATYASSSIAPWERNARGQTYGLCNADGCPDLVAVRRLSGGREGYVLHTQLNGYEPEDGELPLYLSDGTTVVGAFTP
jgi:hypothetical protein